YMATKFFQQSPYETSGGNLLTTRQGGRDNLAQSVTAGHNYVLSSTAVNAARLAFNRTSIHRTNSDFFGAQDVGFNIYDYMPKYLLLNVTPNGCQIGGGTENEARFKTNTYQLSNDLTVIRGQNKSVVSGNWAHWTSIWTGNSRSPGHATVGALVGSDRWRKDVGSRIVWAIVRLRERAVPPQHLECAAVGRRDPRQQPARRVGQPVRGCDAAEHLPDADSQSGRGVHDIRAVS